MTARKKAEREQAEDQDKRDDPTRCGGYVLTDSGWVLDTSGQSKSDDD